MHYVFDCVNPDSAITDGLPNMLALGGKATRPSFKGRYGGKLSWKAFAGIRMNPWWVENLSLADMFAHINHWENKLPDKYA